MWFLIYHKGSNLYGDPIINLANFRLQQIAFKQILMSKTEKYKV